MKIIKMSKNPEVIHAHAIAAPAENPSFLTATAVSAPIDPQNQPDTSSPFVNEMGAREFFGGQKWPIGLQDTFINNCKRIPIRFFICDDSGSMVASDGHRLMTYNGMTK
jgi:hypothetical protein